MKISIRLKNDVFVRVINDAYFVEFTNVGLAQFLRIHHVDGNCEQFDVDKIADMWFQK